MVATSTVQFVLEGGSVETIRVRARDVAMKGHGTALRIQTSRDRFSCFLPLAGETHLFGALAVAGMGTAMGFPVEVIRSVLNTMEPIPGRLESVFHGQPFGVYVDRAGSPGEIARVLQELRRVTRGRSLLLIGSPGGTEDRWREELGRVAAAADRVIFTSDNPRRETETEMVSAMTAGFRSIRKGGYFVEPDRREGIRRLISLAEPGDSILIAGKGDRTIQEIGDTVVPFDDRIEAVEALGRFGFQEETFLGRERIGDIEWSD
jgi:UDP-N-acetylmuramyl tripeptide synthase